MMKTTKSTFPRSTAALLVLVLVLTIVFGGLAAYYSASGGSGDLLTLMQTAPIPPETQPPTEAPTEPPMPAAIADNLPGSVLCKQSYSVPMEEAAAHAEQVVATAGKHSLTNRQLQIYYLSAVEAGRTAAAQPDPALPLDCQLCPLGDGTLSWQHYYLQQALHMWRTQLALTDAAAKEPQIITEEAFKPDPKLHETYIAPELPVNGVLYEDRPSYTPNSQYQAYLDSMDTRLDTLAKQAGYADLRDMVRSVYGAQTTAQDVIDAALAYNLAYMYFTEKTYSLDLSDELLQDPPEGGYNVSLRHVLLIPAGAEVADSGEVIATDAQWDACRQDAEKRLQLWRQDFLTNRDLPSNFARLANQASEDEGSRLNGGFYYNIHKGQLNAALDSWCFDPHRRVRDIGIVQSELGIHIVYLHSFLAAKTSADHAALALQQEKAIVQGYTEKLPLKPDYSAVCLWADATANSVGLIGALYPDIAHERFPEVMNYLQQDYMYHPYGNSYVGRGGCGITTMAMLATYMTDTIHSPGMLATEYGEYHVPSGTNGDIFRFVPAELGFYLDRATPDIEEVIAALQNGQVVISLQVLGHFTRGGHYLLLQEYYPEDDTFQVRDSNVYNYGRLDGHKIDRFTRWQVLSGGSTFWIMQKKITAIPACDRCGLDFPQRAPELLLTEDYTCEKCTAALSRRNNFIALSAQS